ncbi:hypothetical protein [Maribacter vaceletii]|nr:hypothetical protein [Maribacter vaceletii]
MKKNILIILLFSALAGFSQATPRKKKISIGLTVMGQNVSENTIESELSYFDSKPINYDVQFKIGKIFFREKITAGFAISFSTVNFYDCESANYDRRHSTGSDFDSNSPEYYKSTLEMQLGVFAKYKVYDEIFVDAYVGLFGVFPDGGFFPSINNYDITKYNFSIGYGIHLWHFLALEPHISIRNSRKIYMGSKDHYDKISPLSFGLGITFKLTGAKP